MVLEIVLLHGEHLEDAARLFAACYRRARERLPALPARHEDETSVLPMLVDLSRRAPGVAALQSGTLCGYLLGLPIPAFKGTERGAYVPIWGHAAGGDERTAIYRCMYERLSRTWVASGCFTHAVTIYAHDGEAADVWFRNSFGLLGVDALRSLDPVSVAMPPAGVEIRQAVTDDLDVILPLALDLDRHLADGPIFLPLLEAPARSAYAAWLAEPAHTLWLAFHDGDAVAYMRSQPPPSDVAFVVSDPRTISITGAYTKPAYRGHALAATLLQHIVEWARTRAYERCAVDFEAQNIPGSRFWLGHHFQPVCHSLIRRVDHRVAWAHRDRAHETLW